MTLRHVLPPSGHTLPQQISNPEPAAAVRRRLVGRLIRRPAGAVALTWIVVIVAAAALAPWISPYDPLAQDLPASYTGPSAAHWLGADQLGRDILSRALWGARVSLVAVAQALVVFLVVGVSAGLLGGYRGGWVDRVVMRVCDVLMAIPVVITLFIVLAIFSRNQSAAMITFGFLASAGLIRVVRAATLAVRDDDYVQAAVIAGLTPAQVVRRHVFPRVAPPVLIQAALLASSALLVESGLAFLGLGVQPPEASWGGLVSDASTAINTQPWLLVPSGLVIVVTALAFGVVGDTARDLVADRSELAARSWRQLITRVRRSANPVETKDVDTQLLVHVRGLEVAAGDNRLVHGVDLDVRAGEIIGLVGESGCGKTMTISALLRLLPPGVTMSAAGYLLEGDDALGLDERAMATRRGRAIGFVPQEPVAGLDPAFTVGSQLSELVRHHRGVGRSEAARVVRELLAAVRLPEPDRVARAHPHELSGGMAQRVAIARALIGEPRLLVADEPTTALDVTVQAEILELLRTLRDERGVSVVIVTHDWGVVADVCDRAVVMYAGESVEEGTIGQLFRHPRHPYTRALLEANPFGAKFRSRLRAIPGTVPSFVDRAGGCTFADRCPRRTDDCDVGPILLEPTAAGNVVRCLHPEPVRGNVADSEASHV